MSGFLSVPGGESANITRRLSTNLNATSKSDELDVLIKKVGQQWKELVSEDANTLEVALSLMDTSSIGKARYFSRFEDLEQEIRDTLKHYVDVNYQGFNSSIGSYRNVVHSISNTQKRVSSIKEALLKAKSDLSTRRPMLRELRSNSLRYKQMIDILDRIDELKSVPDKLESHISQKQFLSAHSILSHALAIADHEDLTSISALQPIKSYLATQESSLFSIVIEELHNHVYLKSPYTTNRWSAYVYGNDDFSNPERVLEDKVKFQMSESSTSYSGSKLLDDFLSSFDPDTPMTEDPKKNPESDSFSYIRLLIETLASLNRLPSAFTIIHQRLPTELHKLVEKTLAEVRQRYPQTLRDVSKSTAAGKDDEPLIQKGLLDFGYTATDIRLAVLKDFSQTLCSKLLAVLQGHRVIYESVVGVSKRRGGSRQDKELLTYDFAGVFKIVQSELRSMLYSYIADQGSSVTRARALPSIASPTQRRTRDKKKSVFRYEHAEYYNSDEYLSQYDQLKDTLENSVPGLVSSQPNGPQGAADGLSETKSPFAPTDMSFSHQLLIPPNVFNLRVMIDPSAMLLQRAKAIFPYSDKDTCKDTDLFLEEFFINVFIPQLEDSLRTTFHRAMSNPEALIIDPRWAKLSKRPVLKATTSFMTMLRQTSKLLNTGYLYREKYVKLIITTIRWLYNFFKDYFDTLAAIQEGEDGEQPRVTGTPAAGVSTGISNTKMSARLARDKIVGPVSKSLLTLKQQSDGYTKNSNREIDELLKRRVHAKSMGVKRSDFMDNNAFEALCTLATSIKWVVFRLRAIRKVEEAAHTEEHEVDEHEEDRLEARLKKRWTLLEVNKVVRQSGEGSEQGSEQVIVSGKTQEEYDSALAELEALSETCLATLRLDARCRTIYYIDRTMTEGDYYLESDPEERDTYIGLLDMDLVKCDESMTEYLLPKDKSYVFAGLARFMDLMLIYGSENLSLINANGVKKMNYNIVVLQQMLKSIVSDPNQIDFNGSQRFYGYLQGNPITFVENVRKGNVDLSYEECKSLVRLMNNEIIRKHELAGRKEAAANAKHTLNEQLLHLHEMFWSKEKVQLKAAEEAAREQRT